MPAPSSPRRTVLAPALGLFFLAPLVGEFLLGNLPITLLPALVVLAPLYGAGALLIRETARRFHLSWPGLLLLGLTFGVIEEAYTTQSLFNPNYLGLRLLDYGFIPALGISAWWTVFVLTLHTIWSTVVPIALMEILTPNARRTPWLGPVALGVTVVVFLFGCAVLTAMEMKKGFIATPAQFAVSGLVVLGLIALALTFGRRPAPAAPSPAAPAPRPALAFALAASTGGAFWALVAVRDHMPSALNVVAMLLVLAAGASGMVRLSRRSGWAEPHQLGLCAGFLFVYGVHAFMQAPSVGNVSPLVDRCGDVVFGALAVALVAFAARRARPPSFPEKA